MLQVRREDDIIFKGMNRAPTYPPCSRGWIPVSDTTVVGCRPARVLVFNVPARMLGKKATTLGQIAAVKTDSKQRTSQRHEAMGALLGLVLKPPHQIPHESGKPASIGMRETFECTYLRTQHSTAVVLETLWGKPAGDPDRKLVGLRLFFLVFDDAYSVQRAIGLQVRHNAYLDRKALHAPKARVGTKKRARDQEEDDLAEKALKIPDPATARERVLSVSDYLMLCNEYTQDGTYELSCETPLKQHLMKPTGSASALELLDADYVTSKSRGSDPWVHAAAPELLFRLTEKTLACGVTGASAEALMTESYIRGRANQRGWFCLPNPTESWLLIPSGRMDAMHTELPESVQQHLFSHFQMNGCDGLCWSSKPLFVPLGKPLAKKARKRPAGRKPSSTESASSSDESSMPSEYSSSDSESD